MAMTRTRQLLVVAWTSGSGETTARLEVEAGTALVTIEGPLAADAVEPCRAAVLAALKVRPIRIVLDLQRTGAPTRFSLPLLMAMRRHAAWHGVTLLLSGVPTRTAEAIRREGLSGELDVVPFIPARSA
jgi:hypothetical protein